MHDMRMLLRARAEAYEVAMPLLRPPEKLQLLNWNMYFDSGCTCVKETSTVAHRNKFADFLEIRNRSASE